MVEGAGEKSRVITYTSGGADHKVAVEWCYPDGITLHRRMLFDGNAPSQKNLKQGISRAWHPNGRVASVTPYTAGLKDGRCLKWATDGTPVADYTMVNGVGVEVEFYPTGKLRLVHPWEEQGYNGLVMEYHANGRLKSIVNAVHGKMQGPSIAYYDNGKVEYFSYFVDGKLCGPYVHYLITGKVDTSSIILNNSPTDLETYNAAREKDPRLIEIPSTEAELKKLPEKHNPKQ